MHKIAEEPAVVGTKQTLRALEKKNVKTLYIARDAQKQITLRVLEFAEAQSVPVIYVDTMDELAKACNVEVETATAAIIKFQEVK
ncbi:MAG: ribosomal protein L7ae-like protein [Clostridiales bacterium]|jgi:large subunit ribosomal protein L7A|nr:ribosomal protein L7ae-like protein [Clostridiales bacterium]